MIKDYKDLMLFSLEQNREYMEKGSNKLTICKRLAQDGRISDNKMIANEVENYDFCDMRLRVVNSEIKNILSPYNTFFDGLTFYYDEVFEKLSEYDKTIVFFTDFFNFMQGYYDNGTFNGNNNKIMSITLLALFHIGIIKERIQYAQSIRSQLLERYEIKYPNNKLLIFPPRKEAAKYLYRDLITNESTRVGIVYHKLETEEIIECTVQVNQLFIKEGNLTIGLSSPKTILYKKEYDSKARSNSKLAQKHNETVEVAKKFMGVI